MLRCSRARRRRPARVDRVATAARTAPFASFGWGVVALGVPFVAVGAAASILGMPFGVALLLALGLIALIGLALSAWVLGRLVVGEPRGGPGRCSPGGGISAAVGLVPFLNVVVWTLGSIFGLGATMVAAWRARALRAGRGRHRAGTVVARPPAESLVPGGTPAPALEPAAVTESYPATSDD